MGGTNHQNPLPKLRERNGAMPVYDVLIQLGIRLANHRLQSSRNRARSALWLDLWLVNCRRVLTADDQAQQEGLAGMEKLLGMLPPVRRAR